VEGRGWQTTSILDHDATSQECVPLGSEIHLPNYLISGQMHEDKVEVHTSEQVDMRKVGGLEQFPILYRGLG